jgi:dolichol kinase
MCIGYRVIVPLVTRLVFSVVWGIGQQTLPHSFTIGESIVLAQGIALCVIDTGLSTISKLSKMDLISWSEIVNKMLKAWELPLSPVRSPSTLALQVGVLGSIIICLALSPILSRYGTSTPTEIAKPLSWSVTGTFGTIILLVVGLILYPWSAFLLDVSNPLLWLLEFVLYDARRVGTVILWCILLFVCVPLAAFVTNKYQLRNIIARKLFHVLVVLMFVPAYYADEEMLGLSYGVALGIFMLVECIRAASVPPFGLHIATFMRGFIDTREAGKVILTHTYLLLGCALPLWLCINPRQHALVANAGILSLGIGDAMVGRLSTTIYCVTLRKVCCM